MIIEDHIVLQMVSRVRKEHPRMGIKKIYGLIKEDLEDLGIKMGRDALFDLMSSQHMLITRRKRKHITTNSRHPYRKYPNMIRGMEPDGPNQIWVSDITYIKTESEFLYLFLITDMYSKKIVGYKLSTSLDSSNAVNCLQDALENVCKPISGLIHHSDRGLQYCCKEYVSLLESHSIKISMTEKSDPLENPIAERVNGILKEEYLNAIVHDKTLTVNELDKVIEKYNRRRPHLSCDMLTPEEAHKLNGALKRRWKNYYKNRELINV